MSFFSGSHLSVYILYSASTLLILKKRKNGRYVCDCACTKFVHSKQQFKSCKVKYIISVLHVTGIANGILYLSPRRVNRNPVVIS